jgi:predicted RNase H-like nuclease (RuvC/YqgF family)
LLTQRSDALEQLQRELEALKNRLRGEQENRRRDHDASEAAKDAIIDQLRRELHDTQARLNEAENKIIELTTSKAAEIVSQCEYYIPTLMLSIVYADHLRYYSLKFLHVSCIYLNLSADFVVRRHAFSYEG